MSEPKVVITNDTEQEMPEISDDENIHAENAEVEDGELPNMIAEPSEKETSRVELENVKDVANTDSEFVETIIEPSSSEKIPTETGMASELPDEVAVTIDHNQSDTDSDENGVADEKMSDTANELLENGDKLLEESEMKPVQSEIQPEEDDFKDTPVKEEREGGDYPAAGLDGPIHSFNFDPDYLEGDDDGSEEEQAAFMRELEKFHREMSLEFKPPKFYGEGLNCLKLWRAVTRLGGYDQVTTCKLWRQVGESFKPPKTCTTVSWSFRCFYEKALLEYEKHKIRTGELHVPLPSLPEPMGVDNQVGVNQAAGSGRARRDAASRAMQGWHSQRMLGNGEVGDPIIKDKNAISILRRDKHLKSLSSSLKRKKGSSLDRAVKVARTKFIKPQVDSVVVDVGDPADWVKINVRRTKDCFEVYALVPGLLREEVHVQSDPAGRLIISGEPEQPDNPWGVTPFKKIITLPSRIDPHQTSAVVTLHGQLFVRAPFEQSE